MSVATSYVSSQINECIGIVIHTSFSKYTYKRKTNVQFNDIKGELLQKEKEKKQEQERKEREKEKKQREKEEKKRRKEEEKTKKNREKENKKTKKNRK